MDEHHHHEPVAGPWAGGWLVALIAGLFAALVARSVAGVGASPALAVGVVSFLVFGVLMGSGGVELTLDDSHGDGHGSGAHH
jgi:hypothetical protein